MVRLAGSESGPTNCESTSSSVGDDIAYSLIYEFAGPYKQPSETRDVPARRAEGELRVPAHWDCCVQRVTRPAGFPECCLRNQRHLNSLVMSRFFHEAPSGPGDHPRIGVAHGTSHIASQGVRGQPGVVRSHVNLRRFIRGSVAASRRGVWPFHPRSPGSAPASITAPIWRAMSQPIRKNSRSRSAQKPRFSRFKWSNVGGKFRPATISPASCSKSGGHL